MANSIEIDQVLNDNEWRKQLKILNRLNSSILVVLFDSELNVLTNKHQNCQTNCSKPNGKSSWKHVHG